MVPMCDKAGLSQHNRSSPKSGIRHKRKHKAFGCKQRWQQYSPGGRNGKTGSFRILERGTIPHQSGPIARKTIASLFCISFATTLPHTLVRPKCYAFTKYATSSGTLARNLIYTSCTTGWKRLHSPAGVTTPMWQFDHLSFSSFADTCISSLGETPCASWVITPQSMAGFMPIIALNCSNLNLPNALVRTSAGFHFPQM